MFGLDDRIAALDSGEALIVVIAVAALLGLRHATDPDHLTAVSTLIASEQRHGARRAGLLGLVWGLGHATSLFALGLPIVVFNTYVPEPVQSVAEVAIGLVIVLLAARLLVRWRRGHFHAHVHRHGSVEHRHLHDHAHGEPHTHSHSPEAVLGRSPLQSYGIGLVHGVGGSAGVGVLLLAAIPDHALGVVALAAFVLGTAASMALLSCGLGYALTRGPVVRRFVAVAPGLGLLSLAFGVWYTLGALHAIPYPL